MDEHSLPPEPPPLPADIPPPVDDGGAAHLEGRSVPDVKLSSTHGADLNPAELARRRLVLYVFPRVGRPDRANPVGWKETPGAYGCTSQSCAFRDRHRVFSDLGYIVAGLSAQPTDEQTEAARRLHLSFPLLADPELRLGGLLELPTFTIADMTFYKRVTLVAQDGRIDKVFYPVFPPDENAQEVLDWIHSRAAAT